MKITQTTDYELLARLNKHIHELHVTLYPELFVPYNFENIRETFKQLVTNENRVYLVLEDMGEALGYACVEIVEYPEDTITKERKSVLVHDISIIEGQKRRGYGSHLMSHIYDIARSKGIDLIELSYYANNKHASDFYTKQGFVDYRKIAYKKL
ncbi:ribosomal protein S18 acetylase RimI-like enzyme [Paenibacillus rhizosphaerae]|uniref:Ribosomal protein S18 acetylase RimI-like enzyme n=1 Tax=Paenibacillus rhizosphaerae TaxID=297318 RepID=A0A839TPY3_9BACL|nr:GNAT family N-acetyltransferase [Paenibacillus rhizosphaerae]MBB3128573.1 ribosomal protein S18 acetylase RimI-like enzyme [Paenibacillus rhizosphaerae]